MSNSRKATGKPVMINPAKCTRLNSDAAGECHFEDIEMPMKAIQFAPPAPDLHLSDPIAASQMAWFHFPEDWSDDPHPTPKRQLFVVSAGEVEGWTSTGVTRRFGVGDCLLMEDTKGKGQGAKPMNGEASAIVIALK